MTQATTYLELSYLQVGLATLLVLLNGALSLLLRLDLGRRILVAAARTTVQLLLVGIVLQRVFSLSHWAPVMALALLMVLVAGRAAVGRVSRRSPESGWAPLFESNPGTYRNTPFPSSA